MTEKCGFNKKDCNNAGFRHSVIPASLAQVHYLNKAMAGRGRYVIDGGSNLDIGINENSRWKSS